MNQPAPASGLPLAARAPTMNPPSASSENAWSGLRIRAATEVAPSARRRPVARGAPRVSAVSKRNAPQSRPIVLSRFDVRGWSPAQKTMLKGVVSTARALESAVNETERAASPRAAWVRTFDAFPPGQAATTIMPRAMLAVGAMAKVRRKVRAGSAIT